MSKLEYKVISDSENIIIKKKEDKFKLEVLSDIKNINNFIKIIKTNKLFELIFLLNKDIIDDYKLEQTSNLSSEILYKLSVIDDDEYDEFDKYCLKLSNQLEIIDDSEKKFVTKIKSSSDNNYKNKEYKMIDLDDLSILINIDKSKNKYEIIISFKLKKKEIIHIENMLTMLFKKVLHRLRKFLND